MLYIKREGEGRSGSVSVCSNSASVLPFLENGILNVLDSGRTSSAPEVRKSEIEKRGEEGRGKKVLVRVCVCVWGEATRFPILFKVCD